MGPIPLPMQCSQMFYKLVCICNLMQHILLKCVYYEEATKFCLISTLHLSTVHTNKSKVEILQNFVAFSEYMNFNLNNLWHKVLWAVAFSEYMNFIWTSYFTKLLYKKVKMWLNKELQISAWLIGQYFFLHKLFLVSKSNRSWILTENLTFYLSMLILVCMLEK